MKLNYNILWVEDSPVWLAEHKIPVKKYLKEQGFNMNVIDIEGDDDTELARALENSENYDIIFVDYKLDGDSKGSDIIKLIRKRQIFADIVFYSNTPRDELFAAIATLQLDGVYVSSRVDFGNTVEKVIYNTIKKVFDLNNMRGIVMASTSVIDKKIFKIIKHFHDNNISDIGEKEKLLRKILSRVDKQIKDLEEKYKEVDTNDPWEFLSSTLNFNSALRTRILRKDILDKIVGAKKPDSRYHSIYQKLLNFEKNLSPKRNLLGHEEETQTPNEDGTTTIKIGDFEFDEKTARELRNDLIELETAIAELSETLPSI